MDAKTRHRHRLKLQQALSRVIDTALANHRLGIPPDRTTALLAVQMMELLRAFCEDAGLEPEEMRPRQPDLYRHLKVWQDRKKETELRRRRKARAILRSRPPHPDPRMEQAR